MSSLGRKALSPFIALAVLAGLSACSDDSVRIEALTPPKKPTPEQERALASALHRAHLELEEPAACAECHRIQGKAAPTMAPRCLGCHEDSNSALHRGVANEDARECLTCHDFMSLQAEPWGCISCHTTEPAPARAPPPDWAASAPQVVVHAKEDCKACHLPHGPEPVRLGDCASCHEDRPSSHNSALAGAAQCVECHVGHKPAKDVPTCESCHQKESKTALVKGHDQCRTCHDPHGAGKGVKSCESCHQSLSVMAAAKAKEHARCVSCHDPHQSRGSATKGCEGCHEKVRPGHPPDEKLGACAGCHAIHGGQAARVAEPCAACHTKAKSETSFHGGKMPCATCHPAHGFQLAAQSAASCGTCHLAGAESKRPAGLAPEVKPSRVRPTKGHDECSTCHLDPHAPEKPPVGCKECHEAVQSTLTKGHSPCGDCHSTHEGEVRKQCLDCHAEQGKGQHQGIKETCADCHRAHGPKGIARPHGCDKCHQGPLPGVHAVGKHDNCESCHAFHGGRATGDRKTCLTGDCHVKQATHEPAAKSCKGCHVFKGAR